MRWLKALFASLCAALLACGAAAQENAIEVDVELALLVDVSRSMRPNELDIQRRGYIEALKSPEVINAIGSGLLGRVAITYVEWSGFGSADVLVEWTLIDSPEAAHAFADLLGNRHRGSGGRTSISNAIEIGAESIAENRFNGLRKIIDISGDGPNNSGRYVDTARDKAMAAGIVINGLPLMTRDGLGTPWHLEDLDAYYRACVIGGPGSFAMPVLDWAEFALAVRRKIVLELVDAGDAVWPAPPPAPSYDCQIGEKLWEEFRRSFELP
ncbi:MAG: DUF1194 domain-containing protein [Pseudomonadota bacterium]